MAKTDHILQFWAKKRDNPEVHYPLLYHMLDVAAVTRELWNKGLHSGTKHYCAVQFNMLEENVGKWLPFWAGLHDIGKASPDFQSKSKSAKIDLLAQGFNFPQGGNTIHHGIMTAYALPDQLHKTSDHAKKQIAVAVGGHHGIFPRSLDMKDAKTRAGNKLWEQARNNLANTLVRLIKVEDNLYIPEIIQHPALMFLAGLTSVADWIGSNETYFPYNSDSKTPEEHITYANQQAEKAIHDLTWSDWGPPVEIGEFRRFFPFIEQPRPLQTAIIESAKSLCDKPGLVIIEAPMGEGKTEAAMYLADCWATYIGQKGCYFALPTQATSDQMFGRVQKFLENRYHDQTVNLALLHGHAALSAEFEMLKKNSERLFEPSNIDEDSREKSYDGARASVVAAEWFTNRKRGLLSPFGVGTIDQALLSVLQTKHVFVRLFGLAGKTIIIDEVHAYDAYMTTLLERLLEWLAALGSSVVLLSATLPMGRRDALLEAYQHGLKDNVENATLPVISYPRISWVTPDKCSAIHVDTSSQSSRTLNLEWMDGSLPEPDEEFTLGVRLQQVLSHGGCVAVICNTVDRAQKVYLALKKYFPAIADDGDPELDLLHARYLFGDREQRQKRTLFRFGKPDDKTEHNTKRPKRAVLVSTQIIEQSLDLDFDLMVTEMAPVDLILQRAGRLQRHQRKRSENFRDKPPTIWICQPEIKEDGTPDFGGGTEAVYDRHILLRSWLALKGKKTISIPEEVECLIEEVYDERSCSGHYSESIKADWFDSLEKNKKQGEHEKDEARDRWIKKPDYSGELWRMTYDPKEEDDPNFHLAHQAITRLTGLNVSAICLYRTDETVYLDDTSQQKIDADYCPNMRMVQKLLRRSVRISHPYIVSQITKGGNVVPESWRENPLLRNHYILNFDKDNFCPLANYKLCLDAEVGLTIEKN